ncbi:MAG TPA: ABC transporter permease [Bryobacteraceae bacterium]|nr:ABC transporter permease [Bryobacteraceae bacterium]
MPPEKSELTPGRHSELPGAAWLDAIVRDIRFSLRVLRKSPVFTVAAVCTLALGIGANTAIFALLDAVRLRSLPVPDPQQLARIQFIGGNRGFGVSNDSYNLSYPLFEEIRRNQRAFSGVFAWRGYGDVRFGEGVHAHRVIGLLATGDLFPALQLRPAAGRLFDRDDDPPGCVAPGVVLSYPFWQSEFAGRASAIGSKVMISDHPYQVIGVTPPRFSGLVVGRKFDIAMPMCVAAGSDLAFFTRSDLFSLAVMGRLKPGVNLRQASSQLGAASPAMLEATLPTGYSAKTVDTYRKFRLEAVRAANGVSALREQYDTSLWLLLGITGLVLLIACANLGNLMLARAGARQREFAVRRALGASRSRLIRQSLCESLMIASTGAVLGLGLAGVLGRTIIQFLSIDGDPPQLDLSADWRLLAFTATVATLTCMIFGLAPAVRSAQTEPGAAIKSGGRSLTAGRERLSFRRVLMVVQISVSLVLVVGALLFVSSFRNLMTLDPGFREKGILLVFFDMSRLRLADAALSPFQRQLLEEVRAVPLVESAATTTNILIGGGSWTLGIHSGAAEGASKFTWVSPGNFQTLATPILAGRDFNANDTASSPKVAIVNRVFVNRFFGAANPIGKTFRTSPEPGYPATEYQIVGVIKNTRYFNLRDEPPAMSYAPADQFPGNRRWVQMYVRSSAPLGAIENAIRRRMGAQHPELEMGFRVFEEQIEEGLVRECLMAALSGFFGAIAALLATVGVYGVMAYMVVRRRNEIGIRMALGADRERVVRLVMKEAALLITAGVAVGGVISLALAKTAASLLYGITSYDPAAFLGSAILLAAVTAAGSYLPARRAAKLDPMIALRYD